MKTAIIDERATLLGNLELQPLLYTAKDWCELSHSPLVVSFFLWQQSLTLYDTAGFSNAALTAAGGILMIVGFAGYHSMTRSWIALLLCIYAGSYEGYLMVSGTIQDEKQVATNAIKTNPELLFLKENVERTRERYQELKQRYENPEAKVFKKEWFLKSSVTPAWNAMSKAHDILITKQASFTNELTHQDGTKLKIAYRLGLVFLSMILVHQLFRRVELIKP